jgi:hypothetical protein
MRAAVASLAVVTAAALAACSSPQAGQPQARAGQPQSRIGPLGPSALGGGVCWRFGAGETRTDGTLNDVNASAHPVRIIGAWFAVARHVKTDAVYADSFSGDSPFAFDGPGSPPAALRHLASGTVVPPRSSVQILITITAGSPAAWADGIDLAYTALGRSYVQANPWFFGWAKTCRAQP